MTDETNLSEDDRNSRLEGMVIAHRKILADIIARLDGTHSGALLSQLENREAFQDGQEDPGAVPTDGMGIGLAIGEESARIASMVRARSQEMDQDP